MRRVHREDTPRCQPGAAACAPRRSCNPPAFVVASRAGEIRRRPFPDGPEGRDLVCGSLERSRDLRSILAPTARMSCYSCHGPIRREPASACVVAGSGVCDAVETVDDSAGLARGMAYAVPFSESDSGKSGRRAAAADAIAARIEPSCTFPPTCLLISRSRAARSMSTPDAGTPTTLSSARITRRTHSRTINARITARTSKTASALNATHALQRLAMDVA